MAKAKQAKRKSKTFTVVFDEHKAQFVTIVMEAARLHPDTFAIVNETVKGFGISEDEINEFRKELFDGSIACGFKDSQDIYGIDVKRAMFVSDEDINNLKKFHGSKKGSKKSS